MSKAVQFKNSDGEKIYPCPYYPVGSIYLSVNSTNPGTIFGGTWEQIKDRFLLSAGNTYKAGNTGGNTNHHHLYRVGWYGYYSAVSSSDTKLIGLYDYPNSKWNYGSRDSGMDVTTEINSGLNKARSDINSIASYSAGANTQDTSSLPPYLVVYVWKRVS